MSARARKKKPAPKYPPKPRLSDPAPGPAPAPEAPAAVAEALRTGARRFGDRPRPPSRRNMIQLRCSPEEADAVEELGRALGLRSTSEVLRAALEVLVARLVAEGGAA